MFTGIELDEIVKMQIATKEKYRSLNSADIKQIKDLYTALMNENRNKGKSQDDQIRFIGTIIENVEQYKTSNKFTRQQSYDRIFGAYGDNSHLNYFDVFLNEGETNKVLKALVDNKLSSEILRGIKKGQKFDNEANGIDKPRVIQEVSTIGDDSPYVSYFAIIYQGKTIYEYSGGKIYKERKGDNPLDDRWDNIIKNYQEAFEGTEYSKKSKATVGKAKKDKSTGKTYNEYYHIKTRKDGSTYIMKQGKGGKFVKYE